MPPARTRPVLAALIERVDVRVDQVDIHLRPTGLSALFNTAVTPSLREETVILSMPARLRRAGMEIRMVVDGTDPPPSGIAALNQEVTRQAAMIGYIDDFALMLIVILATLPLLLLVRVDKRVTAAADD